MKKAKRAVALGTVATMAAGMLLTGCGGGAATASSTTASSTTGASTSTSDTAGGAPTVSHDKEMTIEIYDVASNFQGEQPGWFGKIVKDKFNLKLNIISPQVAGDGKSLYQTRCAAGNLGDVVILDNADMQDCVDAGLIADIGADIGNYENLMKFSEQINLFNSAMTGVAEGSTYAIPCEMNNNGPTALAGDAVTTSPRLRWDLYTEIGSPDLSDTDALLNALKEIQDAHPTNEAGDKAYAFSLWPDWDNHSIENVNLLTKWYGQEAQGSILLGYDNTIMPLTDKTGTYYRMLKFLNKAQNMGLVDPDSATQDWNTACDKMKNNRVYLLWYGWQRGFTNTPAKGEEGKNYIAIPMSDMTLYQVSDTYYGDGRVWGLGSGVDDEKKGRIMEFLDWLASPEGLTIQHGGTEGLIYTVNADGTYTLTEDGNNRYTSDLQVPDDIGGGLWSDGNDQINQWIVSSVDINPVNNEPYDTNMWSSTIKANETKTTKEWAEKFGAANELEYMKGNGMLKLVASINKPLVNDDTDIALMRSQCDKEVCADSWKMIYAKDDAEFDQMWDAMCVQLEGFGWEKLVEFDTAKYQVVADARKAS